VAERNSNGGAAAGKEETDEGPTRDS
jgi:hypothetical protein